MKIYTKSGDKGRTSLIGGERVAKFDARVEAYGTIDELTAHVALLRDMLREQGSMAEYVADLSDSLRALMGTQALMAIGKGGEGKVADTTAQDTARLESRIDAVSELLPVIVRFTIPGGHVAVSQCHVCRTVCRRAERRCDAAAAEFDVPEGVLRYLNRLSDYLYVLGRRVAMLLETEEELW